MPELDRRDFLKITGLSVGAAATAACKDPVELVIPWLNQPEELVPGISTYYASTCRECSAACGLRVKTREGRPVKVDGNPDDPASGGALCVRGQASLYRTYDAHRLVGPLRRDPGGAPVRISWEQGMALLAEKLAPAAREGKVLFLGGLETGTLDGLIDRFLEVIGSPHRIRFEPFAYEALRTANESLFGTDAVPHFALDRADVLVAFGTDFLETWLNPLQNAVGFAKSRRGGRGYGVHVGPRLGLSGSNLDEWWAPEPGTEILVALALAAEVAALRPNADLGPMRGRLASFSAADAAAKTGVEAERIQALARRIARAEAPLALPPGAELQGTNAAGFAAAVQLLNVASGAIGKTVLFGPDHQVGKLSRFRDLKDLAPRLQGGEVSVLLVHGVNPVYAAPPAFGLREAIAKVPFVASFSSAEDETTALAHLVLPDHTAYEAWGDAEPVRGLRRLQQPTVRPLRDTRALGDVLIEAGRALGHEAELPRGTFREHLAARWSGLPAALVQGGDFAPASPRAVGVSGGGASGLDLSPAQLGGDGELALVVYPSHHLYDGRSARIATLQEIPDPVTKTMWTSVAELHPETAAKLGVELGDEVRVTTEAGSVELPAFPHEAVRPGVVAIQAGRGQRPVNPDAPAPDRHLRRERVGVNALEILPGRLDASSGALAWLSTRAKIERTGRSRTVALAQPSFDQERRGFARATTLAALSGHGDGAHASESDHGDGRERWADASHLQTKPYDPRADAHPDSPYRWGMSIDLDACHGCNACIVACNQENNVPTVGESAARIGREMHWIRITRYVEAHDGGLRVRHAPMLCQHCGAAPCESVCPTLATYHSPEGLNVMVPNRCIGTRFCSNNCPYKARRFNHWSYDWAVLEPENLALNPDVMVRAKGVMEKCTFCVQRIHAAKDRAVQEGRSVRDGEVTPACAETCPAQAIVFGNLREDGSRVAQLRGDARAYRALDNLYTRPAVSYLKAIDRDET